MNDFVPSQWRYHVVLVWLEVQSTFHASFVHFYRVFTVMHKLHERLR